MISAAELDQIGPGLLVWHAYDPKVKAELFSTAISTPDGIFLIDPIPLANHALDQLGQAGDVIGVIITNGNHLRACYQFADRFSVPISAHPASLPGEKLSRFTQVTDDMKICPTLEVVAIDGAAAGEIVLQSTANEGALIVGDALINFEPYGFTLLPGKYCSNQKAMRQSLRKLINRKFERLFFAHGLPVLSQASVRLEQLLGVDPK